MVALGPFLIRKIGLEQYAVLNLAIYFSNLALAYSDFASYTHLLVGYSRNAPGRLADTATATTLRLCLGLLFFVALGFFTFRYPRQDVLYPLLAVFLAGIPFGPINFEWYFIARKRYAALFAVRMVSLASLCALIVLWIATDSTRNPVVYPLAGLASAGVGLALAVKLLGLRRVREGLAGFREVTFERVRALFLKLVPMASALLTAPYFLAFALPWYSLACTDKQLVGAMSISYRLVMGMSSLMAPIVFYLLPRGEENRGEPVFSKSLYLSLAATIGFWSLGVPILWGYFHFSGIDPELFGHSFGAYSILMLGFFFLSLRTLYVGRWLVSGRYGKYFLIVFFSCLPVLLISGIRGREIDPRAVLWLSCLPDLLATTVFVGYDRIAGAFRRRA